MPEHDRITDHAHLGLHPARLLALANRRTHPENLSVLDFPAHGFLLVEFGLHRSEFVDDADVDIAGHGASAPHNVHPPPHHERPEDQEHETADAGLPQRTLGRCLCDVVQLLDVSMKEHEIHQTDRADRHENVHDRHEHQNHKTHTKPPTDK